MQRILYISDFEISGGAEEVHKNTILLMSEFYSCDSFYGSKTHRAPLHPLAYIFSIYYFGALLVKLFKFKPQIVHLHTYFHILTPSILLSIAIYKSFFSKVKVALTAHEYHLVCPSPGFYFLENGRLKNFVPGTKTVQMIFKQIDHRGYVFSFLKKAQWFIGYKLFRLRSVIDVIISPSFFLKEIYRASGIKIPITVIRNPIQIEENIGYSKREELKINKISLLYFGRVSFEKGIIELIEELKKIRDLDIQLTIIGDGPLFETTKSELHHSFKIEWLGRKSKTEIKEIAKEHDAFVLPSLWVENAPLSIIEAYFLNLKILTKDYGGMKEMAELCDNCVLFNDQNLKEKILELMDLKGRNINRLNEVKKQFSQDSYIDQMNKLYKSIYAK